MRRTFNIATLLTASIISSVDSVNCAAASGEFLDQSFVLTRFSSNAGAGSGIDQNVAQSVHAGIAGQLSRIEFWAFRSNPDLGDLAVDIRPVDVNGKPVENNLLRFGQVIVPHANIATLAGTAPSDLPRYLLSVDLRPLNLFLNAGDHFAVNFSNSISAGVVGILGDYAPNPGPYISGQAFLRNAAYNSGAFTLWSDNYPNPSPGSLWVDLGFRTFVSPVPEPATSILLIAALITFAPVRRQRRRQIH
jgi:hypothetical protein